MANSVFQVLVDNCQKAGKGLVSCHTVCGSYRPSPARKPWCMLGRAGWMVCSCMYGRCQERVDSNRHAADGRCSIGLLCTPDSYQYCLWLKARLCSLSNPCALFPTSLLASCSLGTHLAATRSQVLYSASSSLMTCRPPRWYSTRPLVRQSIAIVYVGRPWSQSSIQFHLNTPVLRRAFINTLPYRQETMPNQVEPCKMFSPNSLQMLLRRLSSLHIPHERGIYSDPHAPTLRSAGGTAATTRSIQVKRYSLVTLQYGRARFSYRWLPSPPTDTCHQATLHILLRSYQLFRRPFNEDCY